MVTPAIPKNELKDFISKCGSADLLQLRFKAPDKKPYLEKKEMVEVIDYAKKTLACPVLVNDDVGLAAKADGVHLGQGDSAWTTAKKRLGEKLVGLSAKEPEHFKKLLADAKRFGAMPDYVSVGSMYPTKSKADAKVTGLERLKYAKRLLEPSGTPVFAIGGINTSNASRFKGSCDGIAVISAVNKKNPENSIKELRDAFEGETHD